MGLFGPPNILKLKANRDVNGLIKALSYKNDREIRYNAAITLKDLGDPRAIEPLIIAFKEDDTEIRKAVVGALAKIGGPTTLEPIIAALKDNDQPVRIAAAISLGELGNPIAINPLVELLHDPHPSVQKAASDSLTKLGWKPKKDENGAAYWVIHAEWDKCIEIGKPAVAPLITALQVDDHNLRSKAAESLGVIGDPLAVDSLVNTLEDNDKEVVEAAAVALGRIGDPRAINPLIYTFNIGKYANRLGIYSDLNKVAMDALVNIGTPAIEQLITKLKDKKVYVFARHTLINIGIPAVEPLLAALRDSDSDVRSSAAEALGGIGDRRSTEPLILAIKDADRQVRCAALTALGHIGDTRAIDSIILKLNDETDDGSVCDSAAFALGLIGDPRSVAPLLAALQNKKLNVSQIAQTALGEIGDVRAIAPLIAMLSLNNKAGIRSLVKFGQSAVEPLIGALKDNSVSVRHAAVEALGQIGDSRAIEPLCEMIANGDMVALEALPKLGAPAVKPLINLLFDKSSGIQHTAATGLKKMGWQPTQDESGAAYYILERNWEKCFSIGQPAVKPLITALKDVFICSNAANLLERLGWQPGLDEESAPYWVLKQNWNACIKIGDPAVAYLYYPLITRDRELQFAALRTLEKIGSVRAIDQIARQLINEDYVVMGWVENSLRRFGWSIAKIEETRQKIRSENPVSTDDGPSGCWDDVH